MTANLVLLADDEPAILDALKAEFENNGYRTTGALNGIAAWETLCALPAPAELVAIVVDLQMPPGSFGGRDLIAKIRRAFSTQIPIAVFSGRGTISLSHEVTKAGASAFVEKEQGFSTIVDAVARLVSEAAPIQSIDSASPVRTLAQHGDLPRLTVVALQDIERHLRTLALSGYSPTQLLHDLAAARHKLPSHVEDKLAPLQTFAKESRLSFGDLFDLTIGIATAQLRPSPPPKQLRALKDMLVPIRNDLFHGREVRDRTLLTALLAAQDCLEQFDSLE